MYKPNLRKISVTRYVTPLREGGSLPAIVEADDGFLYVIKFKGAGQGVKALIAELVGGEVARSLGLLVPEIVLLDLDAALGKTEPDQEIQDLLKGSTGLNLGLHYLSGASTFDPIVYKPSTLLASRVVWLDAFITNVDRTVKNTNMLMWHNELWLIDHGAAFYFHHSTPNLQADATNLFPMVKDHVLLKQASELGNVDTEAKSHLHIDVLKSIVDQIPDEWLLAENPTEPLQNLRNIYLDFMHKRLQNSEIFVNHAIHARLSII